MATRVVAVCGSLAEESVTRFALDRALGVAREAGADTDLLDLRKLQLPTFDADADREEAGDAAELAARVRAGDAILLGTPMYHGSYASPLKAAIDYCGFEEFENRTVGLLAVSGGAFPITALEHLRSVMRALDAWVLPFQAAIPHSSAAVEWGDADDDPIEAAAFANESSAERVATLGRRVVEYADIQPDPVTFEGEQNVGADR